MKTLRILLAAFALSIANATFSPVATAQVNQINADINIIPDKINKVDTGIRIQLCIVGIPHTSDRIDGVDLVIGSKVVKATDIDGVDFERYFQFEDAGVLTVEVDFPFKGAVPKTAKLVFHTVRGEVTCPARQ